MFSKKTNLLSIIKKAGFVIFDILILLSLIFLATIAARADDTGVELLTTTDDVLYASGDDITVTFQLENYTGENIALQFDNGCQLGVEIFKFSVDSNGYTVPIYNEILYKRNCTLNKTTVNIPDGKKAIWNRTIKGLNLPSGDYVVHAYVVGYENADWELQDSAFAQISVDIPNGDTEPEYNEKSLLCKGMGGTYDMNECSCPSDYDWSEIVGCQKDIATLEQCVSDGKFIGFSTQDMSCIEMEDITKPLKKTPFSDIDNHWAKQYIENLYSRGIVSGYEDGTFRPDSYINRVELTKMALSAAGIKSEDPSGDDAFKFNDVEGWETEWVYPAWKKGIVKGYTETTFAPGKNITRAEALKIAMLAFGVDVPDTSKKWAFSDTVGHWALSYINQAYLDFIIEGKTKDLFYPDDPITRAESSKIINNLLSK
ncbi:S-layer homology domain-containing protein [bacterium]|nr:S-layer homology domain-containing protein [bacterium]